MNHQHNKSSAIYLSLGFCVFYQIRIVVSLLDLIWTLSLPKTALDHFKSLETQTSKTPQHRGNGGRVNSCFDLDRCEEMPEAVKSVEWEIPAFTLPHHPFGIESTSYKAARAKLMSIKNDVIKGFKAFGVEAELLDGKSTNYTSKGKKTIVRPEIVENPYNGKTYYQWKTERGK